jgi:hypothetical protein
MREYSEVDGASPEYLSKLGKEEYEFMTGEDLKSGHRYGFRMK